MWKNSETPPKNKKINTNQRVLKAQPPARTLACRTGLKCEIETVSLICQSGTTPTAQRVATQHSQQGRDRQRGQQRLVHRVRWCVQGCESGGGGCFRIHTAKSANTDWRLAFPATPKARCVLTASAWPDVLICTQHCGW